MRTRTYKCTRTILLISMILKITWHGSPEIYTITTYKWLLLESVQSFELEISSTSKTSGNLAEQSLEKQNLKKYIWKFLHLYTKVDDFWHLSFWYLERSLYPISIYMINLLLRERANVAQNRSTELNTSARWQRSRLFLKPHKSYFDSVIKIVLSVFLVWENSNIYDY